MKNRTVLFFLIKSIYLSGGSFNNFIANTLSVITAYCFFNKKPAIDVDFVNDGQLRLF